MRRRRSNRNKYLFIAILLLIVVVVAVAVFDMSRTNSKKKPSASQYFIVTHTASIGEFSTNNQSVVLTTLGLNVTAVGGDATGVFLRCRSQAYPVDDYIQTLPKGPPGWDVQITLSGGDYNYQGLNVKLNPQGLFEVDVTVGCSEVESAVFKVLINPQDVVGV